MTDDNGAEQETNNKHCLDEMQIEQKIKTLNITIDYNIFDRPESTPMISMLRNITHIPSILVPNSLPIGDPASFARKGRQNRFELLLLLQRR